MEEKTVEAKYALESPTFRCHGCESEVPPGESYFSAVRFLDESFLRTEHCPDCWRADPAGAEHAFAFWRTRRPVPESGLPRRRRFDLDLLWEFFVKLEADVREERESRAAEDEADGATGDVAVEAVVDAAKDDSVAGEDADGRDPSGGELPPADCDSASESSPEGAAAGDSTGAPASEGAPATVPAEEKTRVLFLVALLLVRGKRLVLRGSARLAGREWLELDEKGDSGARYRVQNPELASADLERVKETLGQLLQMEI